MIRFKEILLEEDINENVLRTFKNNCAAFLEINSEQLKNGNILKRGTSRDYDKNIIKKNFRERREVSGDGFKTWMYEYFRPDNHPSREKMVPTQNGELDDHFRRMDVYGVFPIGHNYKLQYTESVTDFNSGNPYFPHYGILPIIWRIKDEPEEYNIDQKQYQKIHNLAEYYYDEISDQYNDIRRVYSRLWEELKKLRHVDPKIEEVFQKIEDSVDVYFRNSDVSKEIPEEIGLEVNLYAPQGFYYVNENVLTEVIQKSVE